MNDIPKPVAAAASVPFSSTSMTALWMTLETATGPAEASIIPVKLATCSSNSEDTPNAFKVAPKSASNSILNLGR